MHEFINLRPTLGISAGFRNNLVIAGIGSLAFAALAPQPLLAAPTLTLKGSFNGSNGAAPYAPLTPAGNGKFYGTTVAGGANGEGQSLNLILQAAARSASRLLLRLGQS